MGNELTNKIDKALLIRRLKKENINISSEDLDDVINCFNQLIDFYLENYSGYYYRFTFVRTPRSLYESDDKKYDLIFHELIKLKKLNLLHYIDYVYLLSDYNSFFNSRLTELLESLHKITTYYQDCDEPKEDFIYKHINEHPYMLEDVIDNDLDCITESKYINQDYKNIMMLYNELLKLYFDNDYNDMDYEAFFQEFINMTYYYFLINDSFNKEPQEVYNYLTKIKDNLFSVCDKLNLDGEMEYKDRIKYIDSLYKSKSKVKVIK